MSYGFRVLTTDSRAEIARGDGEAVGSRGLVNASARGMTRSASVKALSLEVPAGPTEQLLGSVRVNSQSSEVDAGASEQRIDSAEVDPQPCYEGVGQDGKFDFLFWGLGGLGLG